MTKREIFEKYKDVLKRKLKEANVTGNIAGYQTPNAFSAGRRKDKEKEESNIKAGVGRRVKKTRKFFK
jgi:hypothetical protein